MGRRPTINYTHGDYTESQKYRDDRYFLCILCVQRLGSEVFLLRVRVPELNRSESVERYKQHKNAEAGREVLALQLSWS